MSHRLGSVIAVGPQVMQPGSGVEMPAGSGRWRVTFSPAAAPGGTKFLMLHFTAGALQPGDRLEVELGYDTDVFTDASGPDVWSRPIAGNSVDVVFVDGGSGAGHIALSQFGRGEGLQGNGATNTNADVFLLESPYVNPTFVNTAGVCPGGAGASASWENVEELPPGLMHDVARSVGMFIEAHGSDLSSCSAALIGPDLILTAGHCVDTAIAVASGSFTLDYQTNDDDTRPAGYNPRFHKLKRLVRTGFSVPGVGAGVSTGSGLDYAVVQIETPPGGLGVPPLPMRASVLTLHEELFVIHHPRGATKKVSRKPTDPTCEVLGLGSVITYACDSDNGSSGSPVFDMMGRIVAVNDWAPSSCGNQGQAMAVILPDLAAGDPPTKDVDVVLVIDRSGSMGLTGLSGHTKMQEAREAAALFIDLLRTDKTHRVGLVTFSTAASDPPEFALAPINAGAKDTLLGPAPARDDGTLADISHGGMTSIGGGLRAGHDQLPVPGPATNTPAILLLTDGLQNTHPMIGEVEGELGGTKLAIIGFGTEASLDGPLLTTLARDHDGIYTRAGEGLELKKFFVLAFGNIFQTAIAVDPLFLFPAGASEATPIPVQICDEARLTVVLGWEGGGENLILSILTPGGNTINRSTPGIFASSGRTWVYFRVELPFIGEREGTWRVQVSRLTGGGEFPAPLPAQRFFVTAVVDGGPFFRPVGPRRYYTGDVINPKVVLRQTAGYIVHAAVTVEVEMPDDGAGNILTVSGLRPPGEPGGDTLDGRTTTLIALEQERGGRLTGTTKRTIELFGDGELNGTGALEPDGVFGNPQPELARVEGHYTFHARALYGEACIGTRETTWTVHVDVGIDPDRTDVTVDPVGDLPDGRRHVRLTFCPRDRYGNHLGPGRAGAFGVHPVAGSTPLGGVLDLGNGCYRQEVAWDPGASDDPGIGITQPDRPPIVVHPPRPARFSYSVKFVCGSQAADDCQCAPVRPGHYATEINIHNFHDREVKIEKRILPVVLAGAARGREPSFTRPLATDTIVLPPHSATFDDCCRIAELLLGAMPTQALPLTLGFLEIVSPVELAVSAVYTVTGVNAGGPSIDVESIVARRTR